MSRRLFVLVVMLTGIQVPVYAQLFSYDREAPRPTQSLVAVLAPIDFNYRGDGEPSDRFDFDDLAYGAQYARPGLNVTVLIGRHRPAGASSDETLQLIDAAFFTWGEIGLTSKLSEGENRLFVPVVLHSSHRRVAVDGEAQSAIDAFSVTVLGLGTGLGVSGQTGKVQLVARATPVIGFATRSFGDAAGSSTLFDGDVLVHFGPLVGRVGLSVGYGYRSQRWNVGSSDLIQDVENDFFDYAGAQHVLRAGLSW